MKTPVLVTGGLGFIGSHLVDLLVKNNFYVSVVDNLQSNAVKRDFFGNDVVTHIDDVYNFIKRTGSHFDIIYHLASPVGPTGILKYTGDMGKRVLDDTIAIRDYCIQHKTLLIDVSTSEIYGNDGDLTEDSRKIFRGDYQVRTEYGAAKMLAEIALVNKSKVEKDLKFQIIRPFNVAGSRQRPEGGFVIPRFVIAALTRQPMTVYNYGSQKRSFTDVRDVVDAIYKVSMLDTYNDIWNVGNEENKISILHLAGEVAGIAQIKYNIDKVELVHVDPVLLHGELFSEVPDKIANSTKLRSIGWIPQYNIKDIILKTFKFYMDEIKEGYKFEVYYGK